MNQVVSNNTMVENDTLSYSFTFRDDVPKAPEYFNENKDVSQFTDCQLLMWDYLKRIYPIQYPNNWDYELYSINISDNSYEEQVNIEYNYSEFINDTLFFKMMPNEELNCDRIDSTFFLENIGQPTCIYEGAGLINYMYFLKLNWRKGPCSYIFDWGSPQEYRCANDHFLYCNMLAFSFSKETGLLKRAHF